jgi:hypothetical protein
VSNYELPSETITAALARLDPGYHRWDAVESALKAERKKAEQETEDEDAI